MRPIIAHDEDVVSNWLIAPRGSPFESHDGPPFIHNPGMLSMPPRYARLQAMFH